MEARLFTNLILDEKGADIEKFVKIYNCFDVNKKG